MMSPENKKKYDEKMTRIKTAIALGEPDRVPLTPPAEIFPVLNAGYTVKEVIYDTTLEKSRKAAIKYLTEFDPDNNPGIGLIYAGEGPMMELQQPKTMRWAGMPGDIIDVNSLQQFIEFPTLLDDEYGEFFSDRTGWMIRKSLPRNSGLLDPFSKLRIGSGGSGCRAIAAEFSKPEFKEMIKTFWKLTDMYKAYDDKKAAIIQETVDLGYPTLQGGGAGVPFDMYSDFLRGTLLSLADLYDRPEDVERYIDENFDQTIDAIRATKGVNDGAHVFMALHKGMDGFMSDEHYRKYYWRHLQKIICEIIDAGKVPYIYTEGKYNSRLDCLTEVPPGKVFYHFEDVDMALAKKKLGGIACISGGFSTKFLDWGTPEQVRNETKRILDACAPGGGFIFETACGMCYSKRENVEAMFDTVKTYGRY